MLILLSQKKKKKKKEETIEIKISSLILSDWEITVGIVFVTDAIHQLKACQTDFSQVYNGFYPLQLDSFIALLSLLCISWSDVFVFC